MMDCSFNDSISYLWHGRQKNMEDNLQDLVAQKSLNLTDQNHNCNQIEWNRWNALCIKVWNTEKSKP